ncbi:MAG: zinc ABC transporter substrate-binding protein, partial [Mailhella sp.]|nr:zinc ABC transporter substrate-binding protein [Mailhella sp.]
FCLSLPAHATPSEGSERVLTATVFPIWILLKELAKDVPGVSVNLLLPAGSGCPHDYAMTPNDRCRLAKADILVMNGLGLEGFLGHAAKRSSLLKPGSSVVIAARGLSDILPAEGSCNGHSHSDHGKDARSANPHIFAAPSMMANMARSISSQLAQFDAANAAAYLAGGEKTASRLEALAAECRAAGQKLVRRVIVTQHNIFDYLARDMGLEVAAHVQSHDGQEASARAMLDLVRLIRSKGVGAVVVEPQYPARTCRTLAAETGIPCISLDPAANGPDSLPSPLDWYEKLMRENLRTLEQALGTR